MGQFSNKIGKFNKDVKKRYRATARLAVQDTVGLAQRVAKKGGSMRVDTGFLRASIQGNINSMPSGPTTNDDKEKFALGSQVAGDSIAVTLAKWQPISSDILFIGWTANYARPREHKDGFLRTAVDLWDITVAKAAKKVKNSGL